MSITFKSFPASGGGAGTDTLDDVTGRGSSTANSITVGGVSIGTEYTLPATDGSSNQFIKTDGAGALSFAALDITGGLEYKGSYDASTNSPLLTNAEKGDFYIVSAAGTQFGRDWSIGDHLLINEDMGGVVSNGKIDKIDNTDTPASETVAGVIEIATNVEAAAATATNKALVPSNISSLDLADMDNTTSGFISSVAAASETVAGVIEIATNVEAAAATATDKALVPSNIASFDLADMDNTTSGFISTVAAASETVAGVIEIATNVEAAAATATDKALVPSNISSLDLADMDNTTSGFIADLVTDTSPQLGAALDVNGHDIVSVSNGDIEVDPNGTGSFKIKGNATSGSGRIVLNCEQNSHGITLKGPPHSAAASYTLTFPNTDGTANQVLKTDGSGALDWVDQASGGGGWTYSAITADPANAQASYHYSCTGTFTITLPTSGVSAGAEIRVKNMGTGTITIDPQTQTIDGSTTDYVIDVQYSAITLVSTGSNWEII